MKNNVKDSEYEILCNEILFLITSFFLISSYKHAKFKTRKHWLYIACFKFFLTNGTASGTCHAHEIRKIIAEF
jgi:hypothetical protein